MAKLKSLGIHKGPGEMVFLIYGVELVAGCLSQFPVTKQFQMFNYVSLLYDKLRKGGMEVVTLTHPTRVASVSIRVLGSEKMSK